ncbi:MAG TPA: NUDIX hydrolase [Candidatus Saccharimonadales bacterium]
MANWIQEHVLKELIRHKTRRYSELRPRDIEGNLFMYHLKGLLREGIIEKTEKQYMLSKKGQQHVAQLSLSTGKQRRQPLVLNCIIAKNSEGEYLFLRWHRQPNTGLVSFPHGMMHYGEGSLSSAKRELAEKTGLGGDLSYIHTVPIRTLHNDAVERHMLVRLFRANNLQPLENTLPRTDTSEPFWASLNTIHPDDFIPGFHELAMAVDSDKLISITEIVVNN